ncbi:hypothetical protein K439DRAFT_1414926 [Ramaria rubella]|nr:hypothetical protein K439DRAFT_1414926 [Ramaria rubella]
MTPDFERKLIRRPLSPHSSNDRDKDRISPGPAASLTHSDIAQAMLDSPDEGCTLDFSHKNLGDVGETGAEELATIGINDVHDECTVLRVALGYNRLATLPMAFALLARLRYLNLRANCFTVFPDVLTVMPSLEILDISRNKLKRLPSQPGTLLGLRVFSISKNKLTRLPSYIAKAQNLTVLQVDHNSFEWPPKYVLEPLDNAEDADTMISCIADVKRWIDEHGSGPSTERGKTVDGPGRPTDESPYRTQSNISLDSDLPSDDSDHYTSYPLHRAESSLQHSRSFSVDSDVSNYSTVSHESSNSETSFYREQGAEYLKRPSPLHMPNVTSTFLTSSPSTSPTVSLPPDHSTMETPNHYTSAYHTLDAPSLSNGDTVMNTQLHGRNASYSVAREPSPLNMQLVAKKSLPDLYSFANTTFKQDRQIPDLPVARMTTAGSDDNNVRHYNERPPTPPEDLNNTFNHHDIPEDRSAPLAVSKHGRGSRVHPGHHHYRGITTAVDTVAPPVSSSSQGPAPPMDVERNSYFRRLSTLPPSTISATIPESLLAMIDSTRGILFAVSQIYQSLRHYTVFAIDDRLSGLLGKVLDPASTYMTHLINALDRFDSVSRRGMPPASVCRGVLESCRDNVAVFGKVVGVLHLQLKVLAGSDDARYSRSLLLMLYGSMAEISNSWQTMSPHLDAILPLLNEQRPLPPVASTMMHPHSAPLTPVNTRAGISPIPEQHIPLSPPIPRTPAGSQAANGQSGRSRMRRNAGSFSTRDVQIGRSLPSTVEEVSSPISSPPTIQPLRSALRKPTLSSQSVPPPSQTSSIDYTSHATHSRHGSSSPAVPGGSQSSHSLPHSHYPDPPSSRTVHSSLEVPSDSSKMVDEDLLNTMEAATETAGSVWRMMDEVLHTTKETSTELLESLQLSQDITKLLKQKIQGMRGGAVDGDRKAFWEDAHLFVKAVVSVLTILKAYSVSHPFSAILRSNIAKLTQSTQDFAILLQVSSFSPAPTPAPYSLVTGGLPSMPSKLSSGGISRSRSAQASQTPSSIKPKSGELREVPWSALPHQTFKLSAD